MTMKAPANLVLLLEHADEQLGPITAPWGDGPSAEQLQRDALAILRRIERVEPGSAWAPGFIADRLCPVIEPVFTPGPPRPVPPPQPFAHADIARRSIAGDDEDASPRLPSLRGFLAAAAASGDWGVPIKSGAQWMQNAEKEGTVPSSGTPRHDPCTGREHYSLAQRELDRVARSLPMLYGLTGAGQLAVWGTVAGAGRSEHRNIHAGQTPDAVERAEQRAAKASKRRKRGTMQPPAKRRAFFVPERKTMTSTAVALELRGYGVVVTPHQVRLICRRVTERVRAAFEKHGWIRERTTAEREATKPEWDAAKKLRESETA